MNAIPDSRHPAPLLFLALIVLAAIPVAADDSCLLSVLSIPDGGAVSIDGTLVGTAPLASLIRTCGNHAVVVSANGYNDYTTTVGLGHGNPVTILANLQKQADRGAVVIRSTPPGADLYIDGYLRGKTPLAIDALSPGPHAVLLRMTGYEDYRDTVTTGSGMTPEYMEFLNPLPRTGYLGVISAPEGANATLDGTPLGTTPTIITRVATGNHRLTVKLGGYRDYTRTIAVPGGKTTIISADLEKIPVEGTVIVDSSPAGASVFLDGIYKTVTPVTFEHLPLGNYTIGFAKTGWISQNVTLNLSGGEIREIYAILSTNPQDSRQPVVRTYSSVQSAIGTSGGNATPGPVIEKKYQWYAQGQYRSVTLRIPQRLYTDYKARSHSTNVTSLKRYAISDEDRPYLHDLIGQLKDSGGNLNLAARNDYRNVVSFVQGIPYALHTDPVTHRQTTGANDYWKYPVETLADGNGDCIDDAILAAALLKEMDYDVAIVLLTPVSGTSDGHAVVGLACDNCNGYYYPVNGKRYYYLDLTGSGLALGSMSYPGQNDLYAHSPGQVFVL